MATYCGVDFHARQQTVSWCDTSTGETDQVELSHRSHDLVREFYKRLAQPVIVGFEASGYSLWFEDLMHDLGCQVRIGDAKEIRRRARSRQKNDRRDSELLLELLCRNEFPSVHRYDEASRDVIQKLRYRHKLVKIHTLASNSLHRLSLNAGLSLKSTLLTRAGRERLEKLILRPVASEQRKGWLELINHLSQEIVRVEKSLEPIAKADPRVTRLRTHPGIGLLSGLAVVHTLCPVDRFANARKVTAYIGLEPVEHSSADRQRWGGISKQGSRLVRFLLGQAAQTARQHDASFAAFLSTSLRATRQGEGDRRCCKKTSSSQLHPAA